MRSGDEPAADEPDRVSLILDRIDRFGLTTAEDVRRWLLADVSPNAVQKVLARLAKAGWLNGYALAGRTQYFVPGPTAVRERGLPARRADAYGPQALATAYGTLEFCARRRAVKVTAAEFRARFPDLAAPGLPASGYFIEAAAAPRLGLVLVDHGADPGRVAGKVRRAVFRRTALPAFADLIRSREFFVAVVAPSDGKAAQLRAALGKWPSRYVEVVVEAVPLPLSEG